MAERSGPVASVTGLVIPPVNFFKIFCLVKYLHIISLEIVDHLKCPLVSLVKLTEIKAYC